MAKYEITKDSLDEFKVPEDLQKIALGLNLENEPKQIFETKEDIDEYMKTDSILTIPWRKTINFTFLIITAVLWAVTPLMFIIPMRLQEYTWLAVVFNVISSIIMIMFFIEGVKLRKYGFVLIGPSGILDRSEIRFINYIKWHKVKKIYQGESINDKYNPEPMDNVCVDIGRRAGPIYFQWQNYDKQQFPSFLLFFKLFADAGRKYTNLAEDKIYAVDEELIDQLEA